MDEQRETPPGRSARTRGRGTRERRNPALQSTGLNLPRFPEAFAGALSRPGEIADDVVFLAFLDQYQVSNVKCQVSSVNRQTFFLFLEKKKRLLSYLGSCDRNRSSPSADFT